MTPARLRVVTLFLYLAGTPTLAVAQTTTTVVNAVTTADAPIYLKPGNATPLRVASIGTVLRVLAEQDEWIQVAFRDPQFGDRTGFVWRRLLRIEAPLALQPMDLSIPATAITPESSTPGPIAQTAAQQVAITQYRTRPHPGYKWTGVALAIWGGLTIGSGFVVADDYCYSFDADECRAFKHGWIGAGAVITGVGAALIATAYQKRQPVNTLMVGSNRLTWRVQF